jgi:hypothetical protein
MAFNALPLTNDVAGPVQQHQQRECIMPKGGFLTYDQFILFGDSITEGSANQDGGFGLFPALAHGKLHPHCRQLFVCVYVCIS